MNAEQPHRYSGVTRHEGKWMAKFRHCGKDLHFGHYDDPEVAARVADFARYMCFGINPAMWHHRVGKPNFPPGAGDDVPHAPILRKLLQTGVSEPKTLLARMAAYDAAVEQNAGGCACR